MFQNLSQWLSYIESIHFQTIDMGLDRVHKVYNALPNCNRNTFPPIFLVAGTNGKGSTTAIIREILHQDGYKVGGYNSPHILQFNERCSINQQNPTDGQLIQAFEIVEQTRMSLNVSLTYFEFTTLACIWLLAQHELDYWVIEVGLGGRLDATNILQPTVSVITPIGLDHQAILGNTVEKIAIEKAGIMRENTPVIIADIMHQNDKASIIDVLKNTAHDKNTAIVPHFHYHINDAHGMDIGQIQTKTWDFVYEGKTVYKNLAFPAMRGIHQLQNASTALATLKAGKVALTQAGVRRGLMYAQVMGRFQVLPGRPTFVIDVGHNAHAIKYLKLALDDMGFFAKNHVLFTHLSDKSGHDMVCELLDFFEIWHLPVFDQKENPRVLTAQQTYELADFIEKTAIDRKKKVTVIVYDTINHALDNINQTIQEDERCLVFGSFVMVSHFLQLKKH